MVAIRGVDTINRSLTGAILKANNYAFVCRYYAGGQSSIDKEIDASEVREKSAAGVRIVSNWELQAAPPNTVAEGKAHANAWLAQHKDIGGPDWARCYYSIDTAASAGSWDNYAHGWADVITPERLSVYGDGALARALMKAGLVTGWWQSMSKSFPGQTNPDGSWNHAGATLIQTGRGTVAGYSVDFNTATTASYGGWLLGETSPPEDGMELTDKLSNGLTVDYALTHIGSTVTGAPIGSTGYDGTPGQPNNLGQWVQTGLITLVDEALATKLAPITDALAALAAKLDALPTGGGSAPVAGDVTVTGTLHLDAGA